MHPIPYCISAFIDDRMGVERLPGIEPGTSVTSAVNTPPPELWPPGDSQCSQFSTYCTVGTATFPIPGRPPLSSVCFFLCRLSKNSITVHYSSNESEMRPRPQPVFEDPVISASLGSAIAYDEHTLCQMTA